MKFTHIINPSKIDDPVARMFWEAVRSNFFELDRGVAKSIGGGNSPTAIGDGTTSHHALLDLTNFDDHSQYLYLAGRAGGQTIQSLDTSGAIATLTLKAKLNQTGAHWQCLDSNNVLMARIHGDGGFYCVSGATIKAGAAQVLSLERTGTSQNIQFLVSATPQVFIGGATELSFEHYVRAYRVTALNDNAGLVPLIVRGAVAQSQSLTQWQKDASTVVAKISKDGELSLLTTSTISIPLTIRTTTAGQLDNLTQWMDSVGTILASVNKDGKFVGDGSLLTSVPVGAHTHPETDIVDGTLLARVADAETITGQWTFGPGGAPSGAGRDISLPIRTGTGAGGIWFDNGLGVAEDIWGQLVMASDITISRVWKLPDGDGTLVLAGNLATLTGNTSSTLQSTDISTGAAFRDSITSSKRVRFILSGATGNNAISILGNAKTYTFPNASGTVQLTGTAVAIADGGTGQTTATAAFNALDPLTTKGDIITNDGTNSIRLAVGTSNYALVADSTTASGLAYMQVPLVVATVNQTAKTAAIGQTTLASTTSKFYLIELWASCRTTGGIGDSVNINVIYNDGTAMTDTFNLLLSSTANRVKQVYLIWLASGTLDYSTDLGGGWLGTPQYDVRIRLVKPD